MGSTNGEPRAVNRYLWDGQERLLKNETQGADHVVVAGNYYGKTTFGATWFTDRLFKNLNSDFSLITAPKEDLLKKGAMLRCIQYWDSLGLRRSGPFADYKIVGNPPDIKWRLGGSRKGEGHTTMCRSVHRSAVGTLVAVDVSHAWMDEPGLSPLQAHIEVTKRVRCQNAVLRQKLYTGTPEGVNWFGEMISDPDLQEEGHFLAGPEELEIPRFSVGDKKIVLHGTTYDNPYLPEDYIQGMLRAFGWNPNLKLAYIYGQVVPVYEFRGYDYDRTKHRKTGLQPFDDGRPLWLGWDFNVTINGAGGVSWVTLQEDAGDLYCAAENRGSSRTTWEAVDDFIKQFPTGKWGSTEIIITGDANGWARNSATYNVNYDLIREKLRAAGYRNVTIKAPRGNPSIEFRLTCVNRLFCSDHPETLFIGANCNKLDKSLMQTVINKKGKIVKPQADTHTHPADALGYPVTQLRPIIRPTQRGGYDFSYA